MEEIFRESQKKVRKTKETKMNKELKGWEIEFDEKWQLCNWVNVNATGSYTSCGEEVKSFIFTLLKAQKAEILERIEKLRKKHIIDRELYEDSGGGEMCEVCGKQGIELNEECDRNNDYNQALDDIKKEINGTR